MQCVYGIRYKIAIDRFRYSSMIAKARPAIGRTVRHSPCVSLLLSLLYRRPIRDLFMFVCRLLSCPRYRWKALSVACGAFRHDYHASPRIRVDFGNRSNILPNAPFTFLPCFHHL